MCRLEDRARKQYCIKCCTSFIQSLFLLQSKTMLIEHRSHQQFIFSKLVLWNGHLVSIHFLMNVQLCQNLLPLLAIPAVMLRGGLPIFFPLGDGPFMAGMGVHWHQARLWPLKSMFQD